jgi:hypothetical protein
MVMPPTVAVALIKRFKAKSSHLRLNGILEKSMKFIVTGNPFTQKFFCGIYRESQPFGEKPNCRHKKTGLSPVFST